MPNAMHFNCPFLSYVCSAPFQVITTKCHLASDNMLLILFGKDNLRLRQLPSAQHAKTVIQGINWICLTVLIGLC